MIKYLVIGDHPILKRPDRVFVGQDATKRATAYRLELQKAGYVNTEIKVLADK